MATVDGYGEPALQDIFSKAVYLKLRAKLKDTCSLRVYWVTGEEIKVTIYTGEFRFCKIYANAFSMVLGGMTSEWLANHVLGEFRKFIKSQIFT